MTRRHAFVMVALAAIILTILFTVASADAEARPPDQPPNQDDFVWNASVFVYESAVWNQAAAFSEWQRQVEAARQAKIAAAERERAAQDQQRQGTRQGLDTPAPSGGGSLPAIGWAIARCEGYPGYVNRPHPVGSTASGKFGFLDGTWRSWRPPQASGYARAYQAPEWMQDLAFIRLYNASGTTPWAASRHCWSG